MEPTIAGTVYSMAACTQNEAETSNHQGHTGVAFVKEQLLERLEVRVVRIRQCAIHIKQEAIKLAEVEKGPHAQQALVAVNADVCCFGCMRGSAAQPFCCAVGHAGGSYARAEPAAPLHPRTVVCCPLE